jgi:hypothetical protein
MAIHKDVEGIEVFICVDGERATGYNADYEFYEEENQAVAEHQERVTISNYVESTTGKEFSIHLLVKSSYQMDSPALSFQTSVDENWVNLVFVDKEDINGEPWSYVVDKVTTKKEDGRGVVYRKFVFASIKTSKRICPLEYFHVLTTCQPKNPSKIELLTSRKKH